jgi:hypothetical protein
MSGRFAVAIPHVPPFERTAIYLASAETKWWRLGGVDLLREGTFCTPPLKNRWYF